MLPAKKHPLLTVKLRDKYPFFSEIWDFLTVDTCSYVFAIVCNIVTHFCFTAWICVCMCLCVPKLLGARVCILKSVSILENNPKSY